MIREVDEALLDSLRKGLSEFIQPENIIIGEFDPIKTKSISLNNTHFTVEDEGIGGSGGVKKEEIVETFDPDGETMIFTLSQKPLLPLISVESPVGTVKREPEDYTIDFNKSTIFLRIPPEKGRSVQVKYFIARSVAETIDLKFLLTYSLTIYADDLMERNEIMIETIKVLTREKVFLGQRGISDIRLIRGYSGKILEDQAKMASIVEYLVETTIQIEMPLLPIERIEIGKMEK